jgi:hypothetical protein
MVAQGSHTKNIIQDRGLLVGHFLLARKHVQCFLSGGEGLVVQ